MNTPTGYSALDLVGFTDRGDYSSSETYVKNDLVHYLGDIWRVKLDDITGQTPSEGTYYTIFIEGIPDKAYKTDDTTENTLASDDVLPFYDTSASAKRKMPVQKFAEQLISNPNLLDNPWFTVNQRGFVSTSNSGEYTVDRWRSSIESGASGTISLSNGIMTITSTSGKIYLVQRATLDDLNALIGKRITVSLLLSDDTIISGTGLYSGETLAYINNDDVFIYTSAATGANGLVNIQVNSGKSISIKAIKLEIGSVSTLAMDTAPNYATELLKCQRYFERSNWYSWGCIQCTTAGMITYGMTYPFLEIKRAAPTFTFNVSGNTGISNGVIRDLTAGTTIPSSEVVLMQPDAFNNRIIQMKLQHSSFVVGHQYFVAVGDNCVDISADL